MHRLMPCSRSGGGQVAEVVDVAQVGPDRAVVGHGVPAVVGIRARGQQRHQVQVGDAETGQVADVLADALEGAAEPVGVRRVAESVAALEPVRLGQSPLVEVVQLVGPGVVRRPGDVQQPLGHALRVVVQPAECGHEIGTPPGNPVVELGGAAHGGQYVDASVERSAWAG